MEEFETTNALDNNCETCRYGVQVGQDLCYIGCTRPMWMKRTPAGMPCPHWVPKEEHSGAWQKYSSQR